MSDPVPILPRWPGIAPHTLGCERIGERITQHRYAWQLDPRKTLVSIYIFGMAAHMRAAADTCWNRLLGHRRTHEHGG